MRRAILVIAIVGSALTVVSAIALHAGAGAFIRSQIGGRRSPHESTRARVDGAELTIVYGRPYMRGRTIFGSLVPYDVIWCPGADEATTLESTKPIQIGNVSVPPGPHTIWILPTSTRWTLIVSDEPSGFHTRYPYGQDLGRVPFTKRDLPSKVEQLTFVISPKPSGGGTIAMQWEKTEVSVPFTVQ
jgi:hypothetical protein